MANHPNSKKNTVNEALERYLFNQIASNPNYQDWAKKYEVPSEITDNLSRQLRDYQLEALKHFIFLFENEDSKAKHLLFNMATGTGKTVTLAAIVLYLYLKNYRNFVFLVHQLNIKTQAENVLTRPRDEAGENPKYLFNPKGIKILGQSVKIQTSENFLPLSEKVSVHNLPPVINFMFFSTAGLYNCLTKEKENVLNAEDFKNSPAVILADEAHRLNVDTRKKLTKIDKEDIQNWETAVRTALEANPRNLLLEFTATVDFDNKNILQKYQDKLIYRYDFGRFNDDQYSKLVKPLYNEATQATDQKRHLIVNAIALSQYRKLLAASQGIAVNPIILVKSTKIKQSEEDREFFNKVIQSLSPEDFIPLEALAEKMVREQDERILSQMFSWIADVKNGLAFPKQDDKGIRHFIAQIKQDFAPEYTLIYNAQKKESPELLKKLDDPRNHIRVVFAVHALNEGWDVLCLFDIIHFDISPTKKVTLQDIQLIGRGARLFPYEIPKKNESLGFFAGNFDTDKYKRKFDRSPNERGRILESMFYHFVKTGNFLNDLQTHLLGEGIINRGAVKRTLKLKEHFLKSETYQKGFVLINRREPRPKVASSEIEAVFNRRLIVRPFELRVHSLTEKQQNQAEAALENAEIRITEDFFSEPLIRKALVMAEGNFFRFDEISKHILGLNSVDKLIQDYLSLFEITYRHHPDKEIDSLNPREKLHLLVNAILPEVRKVIDINLPRMVGSRKFYPVPVSEIFSNVKDIWIAADDEKEDEKGNKIPISSNERAKTQSDNPDEDLRCDLSIEDWYAHNENYGTSEEKLFVKFIQSQIKKLQERFGESEIFLLRNELEYCVFNFEDGRCFAPDYLMFINDKEHKNLYYQCLFEAKGGHILEGDLWKEEGLLEITKNGEFSFPDTPVFLEIKGNSAYETDPFFLERLRAENYERIKCLGFKFFNTSDAEREKAFKINFNENLDL